MSPFRVVAGLVVAYTTAVASLIVLRSLQDSGVLVDYGYATCLMYAYTANNLLAVCAALFWRSLRVGQRDDADVVCARRLVSYLLYLSVGNMLIAVLYLLITGGLGLMGVVMLAFWSGASTYCWWLDSAKESLQA